MLADDSGELWSSTELRQVGGDYFNVHNFPATASIPIASTSVFTYSLTILYEDGVTQTQSVNLAIADLCDATSPTTTAPPTTAPQTTEPAISRFELGVGGVGRCWTPDKFISFNYVDFVDGHLNTESYFQLLAAGRVVDEFSGTTAEGGIDGETAVWDLPGHLFDVDELEATTYTLVMWVKYEDGVVESHRVSYRRRRHLRAGSGDHEAVRVANDHPAVGHASADRQLDDLGDRRHRRAGVRHRRCAAARQPPRRNLVSAGVDEA